MEEQTDRPESPDKAAATEPSKSGWGCTIPIVIGFSLLAGFLGYVIWGGFQRGHSQSFAQLSTMYSAIRSYHDAHGSFPPMLPLDDFAENEKQKEMLKGTRLFTVNPGEKDDSGMYRFGEFGTSHHPWDIGSGLPVAYYTDGKGCIVFIPGRDRDFDIKDPAKLFSSEIGLDNPKLKKLMSEGSRGKSGDVVKIFIPATPITTPDEVAP